MNHFRTIFRKEFTDTIRDRRTLFVMVIFPLLLVPLLLTVVTRMQSSSMKKAGEKTIRVGLVTNGNAAGLADDLLQARGLRLVEGVPADSATSFIMSDSLDAVIVVAKDFDATVGAMGAGGIALYYKSSEDYDIVKRRVGAVLDGFEKHLTSERFKKLNLSESIVHTVALAEHDVASTKEKIGKAIGGMVPYFFVIFCFMGSMYPAIDLAAGEKERGTMETLLTAPVSRFQILMGKFAVVVVTGVVSAGISMLGIYVAVRQVKEIPPELMSTIMSILDVQTILLVLSLLLPLTAFFAAFLLSLSIFAKSYKEAQSLISPLTIVIILPVLVGIMPGVELTTTTALIPVLNVSLATKEIIAGTIKVPLLLEVYGALLVLAGLSMWGCTKWFQREETIFRGA
jgi:sodium transport system permease protein